MLGDAAYLSGSGWVTSVLLLSLRLSAVFLMTPILYSVPMPAITRVLLLLGLSVALAAGLHGGRTTLPSDLSGLIQAGFRELALGATLALGILLAFGAFAVAGRLLDIQIGFGIAQVFDPLSRSQLPILTSLFNQIAVLVFFLVDGHHALVRALAYSLEVFPLGAPWPVSGAVAPVMKQAGGLFSIAFALAAPVVFCIALVELALGVVARNLPQMNMLVLGIPIKIVVGLLTLTLWFTGIGGVMNRAYAGIYETWSAIFAAPPERVPGAGEMRGLR